MPRKKLPKRYKMEGASVRLVLVHLYLTRSGSHFEKVEWDLLLSWEDSEPKVAITNVEVILERVDRSSRSVNI